MKKLVVTTLALTMSISTFAFANSPAYPNYVNTSIEAVTPIIAIDRDTLEEIIMARPYAESIGYTVQWNEADRSITFTRGQNVFVATVDSNVYIANGEEITLDTKTKIIDDKAYIPASFKKMLFDAPKLDPIPPTEYIPITPTLPVIDDTTPEIIDQPDLSDEAVKKIEDVINTYEYTDYKIIQTNPDYVTFELILNDELVTYCNFTVDGDVVTLEDLIGSDYATVVKKQVVETAKQKELDNPRGYDFDDEKLENLVIDENTLFFFGENGKLIVDIDRDDIAAGAVANSQFIIKM